MKIIHQNHLTVTKGNFREISLFFSHQERKRKYLRFLHPDQVAGMRVYSTQDFCGYCSDSGALVALPRPYREGHVDNWPYFMKIWFSKTPYRFGTWTAKSKGITDMVFPLRDARTVCFYADIISSDISFLLDLEVISFLLDLEVMKQQRLILSVYSNVVTSGQYSWKLLITCDRGNSFSKLNELTIYFYETWTNEITSACFPSFFWQALPSIT